MTPTQELEQLKKGIEHLKRKCELLKEKAARNKVCISHQYYLGKQLAYEGIIADLNQLTKKPAARDKGDDML